MNIMLNRLKKINACIPAQEEFIRVFGEKASVSLEKIVTYLNENKKIIWKMWFIKRSFDSKDIELVKEIINCDDNVEAKDNNGNTVLMLAARFGYERIVELLISRGANVNAKNNNGYTVLTMGIYYPNITELLLRSYRAIYES